MFPKPIGTSKHDQSLGGGEWPAQRVPQQRWWVRGVGGPWKVGRLRKHKKGGILWENFGECLANVYECGSLDQMFWNDFREICVKTATSLTNPSSVNDAPIVRELSQERLISRVRLQTILSVFRMPQPGSCTFQQSYNAVLLKLTWVSRFLRSHTLIATQRGWENMGEHFSQVLTGKTAG